MNHKVNLKNPADMKKYKYYMMERVKYLNLKNQAEKRYRLYEIMADLSLAKAKELVKE